MHFSLPFAAVIARRECHREPSVPAMLQIAAGRWIAAMGTTCYQNLEKTGTNVGPSCRLSQFPCEFDCSSTKNFGNFGIMEQAPQAFGLGGGFAP